MPSLAIYFLPMNYLIANIVCESFPRFARVFYGLSKSEFMAEPEIEILALKNGIFRAASALGHIEKIVKYLSNPRISQSDIHDALKVAYDNNKLDIFKVLLVDQRLDLAILDGRIGQVSPHFAETLLMDTRIVPTVKDVLFAIFGNHGGYQQERYWIEYNNLDTLRLILADPRLILEPSFCRNLSQDVSRILADDNWDQDGVPIRDQSLFFPDNHVCYTNFRELAHILKADNRFDSFSDSFTHWM